MIALDFSHRSRLKIPISVNSPTIWTIHPTESSVVASISMEVDSGIHELPPSPIYSPKLRPADNDLPPDRTSPKTNEWVPSVLSVLRTTHRYSAYTFSGFSIIHFLNTGVAPLFSRVTDLTFADENLTAARALYRYSYVSEAVLVFGALGVHLASGLIIRLVKIGREYIWYKHHARVPKLSWNSTTGYLIAPFAFAHIMANRWAPWKLQIDVTSSLVGHRIKKNPIVGWSFYSAFVTLSALHITNGLGQWLGWQRKRRYQVNSVVVALWLAGLVKVAAHGLALGLKGRQYDLIEQFLTTRIQSFVQHSS